MTSIKIATRKSQLALWQANTVKDIFESEGESVELVPLVTTGDKMQTAPLADIKIDDAAPAHLQTGKGLFVKEIQLALLDGRANVAVHSMKDLPIAETEGLFVPAVLPRADVRDVMIFSPQLLDWIRAQGFEPADISFEKLMDLLIEAPLLRTLGIGTTSARRRMWSREHFGNDVVVHVLRGNVDSRLARVRKNEFAAILLAKAGLDRLKLFNIEEMFPLPIHRFIPAPAQGAIAIEMPETHMGIAERTLANLNQEQTVLGVLIERWALYCMGGDCHMAVSLHFDNGTLLVGWEKDQKQVVFGLDLTLFSHYLKELYKTDGRLFSNLQKKFAESHCARFIYDSFKTRGIDVVPWEGVH